MNTVTIINQKLQIRELNGQRTITLEDIDLIYGYPEGTVKQHFIKNKHQLVLNEDYFVSQASENIVFLTESGYVLLTRNIFSEGLSWETTRALINNYFRAGIKSMVKSNRVSAEPEDTVFRRQMNIAKKFAGTAEIPIETVVLTALERIEKEAGYNYEHWRKILLDKIARKALRTSDPVRKFMSEFENRFVWDMVPTNFLYDLYVAWYRKFDDIEKPDGRNVFKKQLEELLAEPDNESLWMITPNAVTTKDKITRPEPLIAEYNLKKWINPDYNGSDPDQICRLVIADRLRGIIRCDLK